MGIQLARLSQMGCVGGRPGQGVEVLRRRGYRCAVDESLWQPSELHTFGFGRWPVQALQWRTLQSGQWALARTREVALRGRLPVFVLPCPNYAIRRASTSWAGAMEAVERRSLRQLRFLDRAGQAGARRFLRRLLAMHCVTPASEYGNGGRPGSLGTGEKSQRISDG